MMLRRLSRFFCAVALGLMLFDNLADAAGCQDSASGVAVCHACSCGPHLAASRVSVVVVARAPVFYASYKPVSYALLLSEPIFRPPRRAA